MSSTRQIFNIVILVFFVFGCTTISKKGYRQNRYLLQSTLWLKTSGEYHSLCLQAYNIAKNKLIRDVKNNWKGQPLAVIADLDETVLDNTPVLINMVKHDLSYFKSGWQDWVNKGQAESLPGALDFFKLAKRRGVEIFYISNRKVRDLESTYRNLKTLGFPVQKKNILLRDKDPSKKSRRALVNQKYKIIMLLGDNLGDFLDVFDWKDPQTRVSEVKKHQKDFGNKFIVFPNPFYGSWEESIFTFKRTFSGSEKDSIRYNAL